MPTGAAPTVGRRGRWRQAAAALLVVLACVVLVASVVGLWAQRNLLDTGRFVDRAGPLIEEPAVQRALAARLTDEVMALVDPEALFQRALPDSGRVLAVPLANAVEGYVRDQVTAFLGTEEFARLWVGAIGVAHELSVRLLRDEADAVTAADGQITLDLLPIVDAVLARVAARAPDLLGRQVELPAATSGEAPAAGVARLEAALGVELPDDFGQVTVYDDGTLYAVQGAIDLFDRFVMVLLPLGAVLAALALWLSRRRRRTLLQLAGGLGVGMVLVRRVGFRLVDEVAALPPRPQGQEAARLVAAAFLEPLVAFGAWVLAGAAVVAVVAVLTADHPWAVALRRRAGARWTSATAAASERARDEATLAWIGRHRDALLVAGVATAVAVVWFVDVTWVGLLVVAVLTGAFAGAVHRLGSAPPSTGPSGSG